MSTSLAIRRERPGDEQAIAELTARAFGGPIESRIIDAVRRGGSPAISLVAERPGALVGHILFTPLSIEPPAAHGPIYGLGPMAVTPEHQRQGTGSALVREGLAACARAGVQAVAVVGHPLFYPRFGFRRGSEFGLRCEFDVPDEVFMAVELRPGALTGGGGLVRYLPEFAAE